jgi:hypothetical protein
VFEYDAWMKTNDALSEYVGDLLEGSYDCVDRVVIKGYFRLGQQGAGMRVWWRSLRGSDDGRRPSVFREMAGTFSRRLRAYAQKRDIPLIKCSDTGKRPFEVAAEYAPKDPKKKGVYLILITRAPALVWDVKLCRTGAPHLERRKPWPYVQHYHFHIQDPQWGHMQIRMSGYPPYGIHVTFNGHEWVQRRAQRDRIEIQKVENCFVGGDVKRLNRLGKKLRSEAVAGRLGEVIDRWVYSSCLCFGLTREEQTRSGFHYDYSCSQMEYSRNLIFRSPDQLDKVYQGLIDRTARILDVPKLKTIFGRRNRPHRKQGGQKQLERILDRSHWDLTVFKLHFGRLTLKMYDKGDRVLRIEAIAYNIKELRCGKRIEKLLAMLEKLQLMVVNFLNTVQAAHIGFLDAGALDQLAEPTQRGTARVAGVDIQKPRVRAVLQAVLPLAADPHGFTTRMLAEAVRRQVGRRARGYGVRHAAYDLRKLRGKRLVKRVGNSRRYRITPAAFSTVASLLILREKVIKPVLAGAAKPRRGRPPKNTCALDQHYVNLQREMLQTFKTLGVAA